MVPILLCQFFGGHPVYAIVKIQEFTSSDVDFSTLSRFRRSIQRVDFSKFYSVLICLLVCFSFFLLHSIVGNVIIMTYCRPVIKAGVRAPTSLVVLMCACRLL